MSAAQVVSSLNAADRPAPVPAIDVKRYLQLQGKWAAVSEDARNHDIRATKLACVALVDALSDFETFDLQDASILAVVTAALGALKNTGGTGHISDAEAIAILAMENGRQSRAQELGIGRVREGHVEEVRA